LHTEEINASDLDPSDFVIGTTWTDMLEDTSLEDSKLLVEHSCFTADLTKEEIDILATIMMINWV